MPTQDKENQTGAEVTAEAERRKQELQEQNFKKSEKLLPFLNAKADNHQHRIASLNDKIAAREDKITASTDKIAKLTAKADRLEDTNKALKAMLGSIPFVKGMIERNEAKIAKIREVKIPAQQEKITANKSKVAQLTAKRDKVQHKLDRVLSLNNVIKSFGIGANKERRQAFTEALGSFQKSSIACMTDKLNGLKEKRQALYEQYNAPETSAVDKLKIQDKINAMTEKIEALSDKIDKVSAKAAEMNSDHKVDEAIEETAETLAKTADEEEVSMPDIADDVLGVSEKDERQALMSVEIFGEVRYFKVDEQSVDDILKASKEDKPLLKLMEMGDQISVDEYAEIQQSDKFTFAVEMDFDNDSADIYVVNDGKGGIAESDRNDDNARIDTIKLSDYGKEVDTPVIEDEEVIDEAVADEPVQTEPKKEDKGVTKVNPEYYASLAKNDRSVNPMPKNIAEKVMEKMEQMNIPFSAVERKGGLVAVTVSKANEGILKAVEKQTRADRGKQLVNPEFFKSLTKSERFTQRMTEDQAQSKMAELDKKGIEYSAVLDGDRSGVTVRQTDKKQAFFSVKQLRQKAAKKSKQRPPQQKQKTKSKSQGLE